MSTSVLILTGILLVIALYSYLKIILKCIEKVKILKPGKKYSKGSTTSDPEAVNAVEIAEYYPQPPGPLPLPVLGNLALLGQYDFPFEGFKELAKIYGDIYMLTLGSSRVAVVNSLDLIREVLNQNGKFFGGRPDFLRFNKLFGGDRNNSLALCDWSELQQKRRNLARKHCSPRLASSSYSKMNEVGCFEIQEFFDVLDKAIVPGEEIEMKNLLMQASANMFIWYMCSIRFDYADEEFQKIVECFDDIFWEINQGHVCDFLPFMGVFYNRYMNKIANLSSTIRNFILERIVNERERNLHPDEPERDFTDALLKSISEEEDVSRETIIYMLEDFIGGHSAIGNMVMLSLGYIARNPTIGQTIQEEIDRITEGGQRTITMHDMESMPYTMATIYEVLRYSSSPIVPHVSTENTVIQRYGIPKNTLVLINNYTLNTSEEYWENPKEFNPHRFVEYKDGKATLQSNMPHFLPFSIGKRTCIGQNLLKGYSFLLLANTLQKYNISCKNPDDIKMYPTCVALPSTTYKLTFRPRNL